VTSTPPAPPAKAGVVSSAASAASAASLPTPLEPNGSSTAPTAPAVVLHIGDSTVGEGGGLEKALEPRFRALGSKYVHDAWTGASIVTVAHDKRVRSLLAKYDPDLVIVTLGANDLFLPSPSTFAVHVATLARKVSSLGAVPDGGAPKTRACIWMGPPAWKKDTGIVDVIRNNCQPCRFFDASLVKLERIRDGVHPTDKGGETWAALFWDFYRGVEASDGGLPPTVDGTRLTGR
jgi:lysophospholipase L1-like esterase